MLNGGHDVEHNTKRSQEACEEHQGPERVEGHERVKYSGNGMRVGLLVG